MRGFYVTFSCLLLILFSCHIKEYDSDSLPISHKIWNSLLSKHVQENGLVDYKGFIEDSIEFEQYINLLATHHPNKKFWSEHQRLAYWINAYNAFTVKTIIDNYPVISIKKIKPGLAFINSIWDEKNIFIEEVVYDLNNIEHDILRKKFQEPRIHFAINCASISCPNLYYRAYVGDSIDFQLNIAAKTFINDATKNNILHRKVQLSKIFKWYQSDFTVNGTTISYINKYSDKKINPDTKIDYMHYNWILNEVKQD